MTKETWNKLNACIEAGDPIKDVCDETDLVDYIFDLRKQLGKKDDEP